jgi:hypothetical protein
MLGKVWGCYADGLVGLRMSLLTHAEAQRRKELKVL